MPTDETAGETTRRLLFTVLVLLLTVTVLLWAVVAVPLVGSANAETKSSTDGDAFTTFAVDFESADPEEPDDVEIQWNLSDDANQTEKVRIEITNESGSPINVFRTTGEDVPNSFTVSEERNDSKAADIIVDDLSTVALTLKIPPGHCDRVEAIEFTAFDDNDDPISEPNVERTKGCTSTTDVGTFEVTIDEYDEEVSVGEDINVTANVENTGSVEATQDVRFLVDGDKHETTNLTLAAGQNETVNFSSETNESDVGKHEIVVESDDDAANRSVTVVAPAFFAVSIEEVPREVAAGETITVTARIRNTGYRNGTQNVTLVNFDGEIVGTAQGLELSPNESTTVPLTWSTESTDAGVGNVTVSSDNDTDTAAVEVTQPMIESIVATLQDSVIKVVENTSITVEAKYTDGSTRPVTDNATLTANDSAVATVTTNGTVTAESEGQTVIEATFEGETDTETLVVETSNTDDSESDDSSADENSTSDTSSGDSDFDDTGSDDEASGNDETGSDNEMSNSNNETRSDDEASNSDDIETDDAADSDNTDVEDSEDDSTIKRSDTDDFANSHTDTGETDRTTIVFFPALGLLMLPMLVLANRHSGRVGN